MKCRTIEHWQRLSDLPAMLDALPDITKELGFRFHDFSFCSPGHHVESGNLPAGAPALIHAALELSAPHQQGSELPLFWTPEIFAATPDMWARAQAMGLTHGWVQPLHDGTARSSLALLRPDASVSAAELYEKAAIVIWVGKQLHRAAAQAGHGGSSV
ncbi:autoinducer binding domain-containing protein [Pseudomonas sp. S 311-6]|uniref:autoinducer binding domain-containing protein n=1 Tax=Pseudomonas TaxID=286 RepID=UPI0020971C54|nr:MULTISPECIES: autoinducer binding domain-containing protein [Pseudomonas]MCO7641218.1 autoinducer binding domain-containing protein [Pseudomonas sp. S 311-6]MCO7565779.1 autoinducer binding domain-containing protein [Pseudomonas mosselii]MCO7594032.1 autoinducer binding domain-containing protein [Pseudomonas guariconensis]MCO7616785.1 autoinducer binding domain-containing protein [Pseudomonas guariconensis]MCO7630488.1 autoinducer binding domain-containing protein [Pseudomonas guariconensis